MAIATITSNNKYNILVVDDNPDILELTYEALSEEGYQVTKVTRGESALEALENKHFDMVITDINLGKVNGIRVLRRAKELNPETKVIITTGNLNIHYAIEALRLHADDYILKPFSLYWLIKRVYDCLTPSGNKKEQDVSSEDAATYNNN